jgi:DNA processing protein
LKEIYLPPTILYWQGTSPTIHAKTLAVVGSRKANTYGKRVIEKVIPELVAHGFTIISGGALGADSMAHETTVWCGGKTVAVIGSGLLKPYPRSNKKLFEKIIENGGSIVSSFALQCDALLGNFPARNRIISGLSQGCIVVQAAQQSGAKITAQCALEQGRHVFAVPGPIDDELSWGCHELITQGATLINDVQDIIEELPAYVVGSNVTGILEEIHRPKVKKNYDPDPTTAAILQACQQPVSTDDLLMISGLELPVLTSLLFQLQLDGKITQNMMGLWQQI